MSVAVGILGATGYTGAELFRLLALHPEVRLAYVSSERFGGQPLAATFPHLRGFGGDPECESLDPVKAAAACEVVFCALPHKASMGVIGSLLQGGCKVVDLSADFRLHDALVYQTWYAETHLAPELLGEAVYGLPELHRESIRTARLVANPGCYPTASILALAPLLEQGLVTTEGLVIDAKSGVSGAGRAPAQGSLFAEMGEGFRPYKVVGHRHTPEIEQELSLVAGCDLRVRFTPHLLPQSRGILATCYTRPLVEREEEAWLELYRAFYRDEPFVRVAPAGEFPSTSQVRGSNFCDLGVALDRRTGTLVVMAAIDNLVKGAAGQAVQNMNLLLGLRETMGLEQAPLFP